jgi:Fic-DOC domain mobile mystery protein B
MPIEFETPEGSTPLRPEELEQLVPAQITTMAQLNAAEQLNIAAASIWVYGRRRSNVLTADFARQLHRRMFSDVWRWAGDFRKYDVNIGNVDPHDIQVRLHQLFDDCRHWTVESVFPTDEIAARLHHLLTLIHPFPNGNGRHARLMADVYLRNSGEIPFSWGAGANLVAAGEGRVRYLAALRAAADHDIRPLIAFARS